MKYTNEIIINKYHKQEKLNFLFFWGHQPNKDGSIGKSCFSQWWKAPFKIDGITYPTAEHYMMASKAILFKDDEILEKILNVTDPHNAKKLGRKVRNFTPDLWDQHKFDIVVEANMAKFSQNSALKTFLLHTKDAIIVEASPRDRIWGIGMGQNNEKSSNPNLWRGKNLLGYALMEVRDRIKEIASK
ncbi:NADAR family protein [Tenacibaculum maritimum]|uniref:NADAR family protein n=1 Tax=Tenacibaculum maritimum TaxID=107401 RepID=UPI00040CC9A6|nr:NADAR family protein [Tenacibaculum maritimum]